MMMISCHIASTLPECDISLTTFITPYQSIHSISTNIEYSTRLILNLHLNLHISSLCHIIPNMQSAIINESTNPLLTILNNILSDDCYSYLSPFTFTLLLFTKNQSHYYQSSKYILFNIFYFNLKNAKSTLK